MANEIDALLACASQHLTRLKSNQPEGEPRCWQRSYPAKALILAAQDLRILRHFPNLGCETPITGGSEHDVWYFNGDIRVFKATNHGGFGLKPGRPGSEYNFEVATALDYLRRLLLINKHFEDDIRVEGVWLASDEAVPRIVTSQRFITKAREMRPEEISDSMKGAGFIQPPMGEKHGIWTKQSEEGIVVIGDVFSKNVILEEKSGIMVIVDAVARLIRDGENEE